MHCLANCLAAMIICNVVWASPAVSGPRPRPDCPTIGAIRWDAWFGAKGVPGSAVERSLGPERWHDRLPACARVIDTNTVQIFCDGLDQLELESTQARLAGITYWAFVAYDPDSPMSIGLSNYLRSSKARRNVNFALVSELVHWGGDTDYLPVIERFAHLMTEPTYQRTDDGRPMFFLGSVSDEILEARFGGRQKFAAIIAEFRALSRRAGAGDPFIVLLDSDIHRAKAMIADLQLDGVSAYAIADDGVQGGEYAALASLAGKFWSDAIGLGLPLVPLAMTGWDRRPRVMNPVPWENGSASMEQMTHFYKRPEPKELAVHVASALETSRSTGPSSVLIYAWNEFDEGGWLAPTRGDKKNDRLHAVRKALTSTCPSSRTRRTVR
jgi:hypothetical protein